MLFSTMRPWGLLVLVLSCQKITPLSASFTPLEGIALVAKGPPQTVSSEGRVGARNEGNSDRVGWQARCGEEYGRQYPG